MINLTPYLNDDEYISLTLHIQDRLDQFERLPYPTVKEDLFDLLGSLDMLHREALVRMLSLIEKEAPALIPQLEQDFIIKTVLSLYEFIAEDSEAGLPPRNGTFIPIDQIGVSPALKQPVWIPAGHITDIPPNTFKVRKFEDVELLLCHVDEQIFAVRNACLDSILPLSSGQLEGYILTCPWHGCRYDIRTGAIQNDSGLRLETFPVAVDETGRFSVGFNIPSHQRPPG